MKLSDKLIELRKEKGWSQEDFAEKLDVSRQAISRWENGTALPDAQNILRISKLFNVTADYLLNDDYEGDINISAVETATEVTAMEETAPLAQKKERPYLYLIPAICFVILTVCVIIMVVMAVNDPTNHPILNSVKEKDVAPTCSAEGSYDEVLYCKECGEEIMRATKSVAKLPHALSKSVKENEVAATCRAEGSYDEVICCKECGEELMRTTKSVAKLAHTLSKSVKKNEVAPTCAAEGSYDEVVYCARCGDEVLRTHRITETVAHKFQNKKCVACGEPQPSEGLLYMSKGNGTCFVDIGDCTDENIVIPAYSPSGEKVVQIKAYAFAGYRDLKSVRIPETVTMIGEGAFENCVNLESVNLPSNIKMIYSYTFNGCEKLKDVTIPAGVYYIGEEAFADCIAFESIVIPANVTKIGKFAFRNFSGCDGTVIFEIYDGWGLFDDSENLVDFVDFSNSFAKPDLFITFRYSDYVWKRDFSY